MYLSYDSTSWRSKGKGAARRVLADINPNSYLQTSSKMTLDDASKPPDPLAPAITSSCIVGFASSPSILSLRSGPTPQPRINALPTELLTTIFLLCLPSRSPRIPDNTFAPLLLCHVCSYWRRLARATPFLWQDLDLGEVRPGIMKQRVFVCDEEGDREKGVGSMTPYHHTPHPRTILKLGKLCLHTLSLPSITTHFATLAHPLPLRSLKIDLSRYRWDVKTDWERTTRSWVVERLVPVEPEGDASPFDGEMRRATIHRYRNYTGTGDEEEEYYYYELISARDVLESVLVAGEGLVAGRIGALDVSMDDLDDLPRIRVRALTPTPSRSIPTHIPGTSILTSPFQTPTLTPTHTFPVLHTLTLSLPHLLLSELFDSTLIPGAPTQLWRRLRGVGEGLRKKWGFICGLSSGFILGVEGEGYTLAFCHESTVPNLRRVQVDVPWVALVPGRYTSSSNDRPLRVRFRQLPRNQDSVDAHTEPEVSLDALSLRQLSILPFAQLTQLTIVDTQPVPVWLLRALLVECVALTVGRVSVVAFRPPPPSTAAPGGVGGAGILGGGGGVNANGVSMAGVEDLGLNVECYWAFGGDPVIRALSQEALHREGNPGISRDPSMTIPENDDDGEKLWNLPQLKELTLRFGCSPRKEDLLWVQRAREVERGRWGNQVQPGGVIPPLETQIPVRARRGGDAGRGTSGLGEGRGGDVLRKWRDVVVVDEGRVMELSEVRVVEFALGGFVFGSGGGRPVVRIGFNG